MTRTPTLPLDDKKMWRRLIALAHPDRGGEHELFIWTSAVRDAFCGVNPEANRAPDSGTSAGTTSERVPFETRLSFDALTRRALSLDLEEPYASIIGLLADCRSAQDSILYRQQYRGATYKQLAAIGHRVGLTKAERVHWYRICESLPLAQRHAGHILGRLQQEAA